MSYSSRRSAKRFARKSKRNFIITLILTGLILYFTFKWILPFFIGGVSFIKDTINSNPKISSTQEANNLAPPVLNIAYEATNTAQIDISGYGTPHSKVTLFLDDQAAQTIDVSSEGTFTFTKVPLKFGTNNIYAKTIDQNKVSLPSKEIKVILDNEKPSLNILEPDDNKQIQGGDKKVKVAGKTEAGSKIFINDNQTIVDSEGNFLTELSLNEGDNIISIKAVDFASNSTEVQRKVTYKP